jgi:hypothetical protein
MEMRRFGLLILVLAAAVGLSAQARAATVITLDEGGADPANALGPGIWEVLIESPDSNAATNQGGQFGIVGGLGFNPNLAVCDTAQTLVICAALPGADLASGDPAVDGTLYLLIAVAGGNLASPVPVSLGTVSGNNLVGTIYGTGILTGVGDDAGFSSPVSFERNPIPEPAAFAFLGVGLASLAFLRRRAA